MLRETFGHVLANVPGALAGDDPEYLHQLRVGTRRVRAALRVFRTTLHRGDRRALTRLLRSLAKASGPARDWDVNLGRLPLSMRAQAGQRRRAAHARLRRALAGLRLDRQPRARARPAVSLPVFAGSMLDELHRKARRRGADIDWKSAAQRHALRIRLRRLRYACEFLAGAFPKADGRPLVQCLKALQGLLGELNDLEVLRGLLRELGAKPPRRAHAIRERALIARLPAAWRRFTRAPRFWGLTPISVGRAGRTWRR